MDTGHDASRARNWRFVAGLEVLLAAAAVIADAFIPTFVLLGLAAVSLLVRRRGPATIGFHRLPHPVRSAAQILVLVIGWTVLQLSLIMPVAQRLTGQQQDVSQFASVEGNLPQLAGLVLLSWTLAAVGEEAAYRGYLFTRIGEFLGGNRGATFAAAVGSSALFGLAHTEQGSVGVILTFADALALCWLRQRYASVWAAVLGHGFNNTIGLTAYYLVGPIGGLW
jgi:hypothetical protein